MSDNDKKENTQNTGSDRAVYDNCQPTSELKQPTSDDKPPIDTDEDD